MNATGLEDQGHRPQEIGGFTLFWNSDKREGREPGWQMSVCRKGEDGWDVQRIPEDQAQAIFALLVSSGHPDGPWKVIGNFGDSFYANVRARAENSEVRNGLEG